METIRLQKKMGSNAACDPKLNKRTKICGKHTYIVGPALDKQKHELAID